MAIDTTFVIPTWQQCQQLYSPDLSSVEYTSFDKVLNTISGIGQGHKCFLLIAVHVPLLK
jgi:hypothetical protein